MKPYRKALPKILTDHKLLNCGVGDKNVIQLALFKISLSIKREKSSPFTLPENLSKRIKSCFCRGQVLCLAGLTLMYVVKMRFIRGQEGSQQLLNIATLLWSVNIMIFMAQKSILLW